VFCSSILREHLIESIVTPSGLYVKLAQALATQGAVLPPPYLKLAKLLDNAEHFDYSIVEQVGAFYADQKHSFLISMQRLL